MINSHRDAKKEVYDHIQELFGYENCKKSEEQIAWRVEKDIWLSPRRVFVTEYDKDLYRFRNDFNIQIIRSIWPFNFNTNIDRFELTIHASEITRQFINSLVDFINYCTERKANKYYWSMFAHEQSYPTYAWSEIAKDYYNRNNIKQNKVMESNTH